jgi:hypothetical protein
MSKKKEAPNGPSFFSEFYVKVYAILLLSFRASAPAPRKMGTAIKKKSHHLKPVTELGTRAAGAD